MRGIFWRELRELALVGVPLLILTVLLSSEFVGPRDKTEDWLLFVLIGGMAVGVFHGVIDRARRDDLFFHHRPIPALRLQAARTAAGLTVCLAAGGLFLLSHHVFSLLEEAKWRELSQVHVRFESFVPVHLDLGRSVLAVGGLLAGWAVLRMAVATRALLAALFVLLAAPFTGWAILVRQESFGAAGVTALVLAALCATFSVANAGSRRIAIRSMLILLIAGAVFLEALSWLRSATAGMQMRNYPYFGFDTDGKLHVWESFWGEDDDGRYYGERIYDLERNLLEVDKAHLGPEHMSMARRMRAKRIWSSSRPGLDWASMLSERFEDPAFFERHPRGRRRWPTAEAVAPLDRFEWHRQPFGRPKLRWEYREGRFVCLEVNTGRIRGGLGPDGFSEGERGLGGERFVNARLIQSDGSVFEDRVWHQLTFLEGESGRLVRVRIEPNADGPVPRIEVTTKQLGSAPVEVVRYTRYDTALLRVGSEWVVVGHDGEVSDRFAWDPENEVLVHAASRHRKPEEQDLETQYVVVTSERPVHPTGSRVRARLLREGKPPVVVELDMTPKHGSEHFLARLTGFVALLRPPLLNAASFVSPAPESWAELNEWWWRDPFFGGGAMAVWLFLSLLVGAACAFLARRSAGRRSPASVRLWTAVGFLLGPLGLLWMRLVVPHEVVADCPGCSRPRAVNVESCPSCETVWPAPEPKGIEVLV